MKDLNEELEEAFEHFKNARAQNDDHTKKAAEEVLKTLERINSEPHSAALVASLGEEIDRISKNAARQQQIEKEVNEYLQKVNST